MPILTKEFFDELEDGQKFSYGSSQYIKGGGVVKMLGKYRAGAEGPFSELRIEQPMSQLLGRNVEILTESKKD